MCISGPGEGEMNWCVWFQLFGEPDKPWELWATFHEKDLAHYRANEFVQDMVRRSFQRRYLRVLPKGRKPKARRVR